MRFEETDKHLIFRNVTIAREMIQKYDDGSIVKTAEELKKADVRALKETPIVKFYDQHSKGKEDERIVGFALPPIGMPSFNKGKIKRDIYYDKEVITQQELQELRTAPHSSKKDVSIGFIDNTQYQKGLWNGQPVDGYSKDMLLDHLAWVEHGRCSTNDGCGLVRSDKQQFRMDAITIVNDNKGESKMVNEDCKERTDEEKMFLKEAQKAIILTLEEHAAAEKARYKADSAEFSQKLDSILELLKVDKFPENLKEKDPKEKEKKEKEEDEEEEAKKAKEKGKKDSVTEDSVIADLKARIGSMEKEAKEQKEKPREDVRYTYSLDEMIAKEEAEKNKENE